MNRKEQVRLLPVVDLAFAIVIVLIVWYVWSVVTRWWPW